MPRTPMDGRSMPEAMSPISLITILGKTIICARAITTLSGTVRRRELTSAVDILAALAAEGTWEAAVAMAVADIAERRRVEG
jgi:hypothetical protein